MIQMYELAIDEVFFTTCIGLHGMYFSLYCVWLHIRERLIIVLKTKKHIIEVKILYHDVN